MQALGAKTGRCTKNNLNSYIPMGLFPGITLGVRTGRKEEMGLCRASADRLDILCRLWTNACIKPPFGASSAKTPQGGSNACAPTGPVVRSHLHGCRLAGPPEGRPTSRHPSGSSRLSRYSSLQGEVQEGLEWNATRQHPGGRCEGGTHAR